MPLPPQGILVFFKMFVSKRHCVTHLDSQGMKSQTPVIEEISESATPRKESKTMLRRDVIWSGSLSSPVRAWHITEYVLINTLNRMSSLWTGKHQSNYCMPCLGVPPTSTLKKRSELFFPLFLVHLTSAHISFFSWLVSCVNSTRCCTNETALVVVSCASTDIPSTEGQ